MNRNVKLIGHLLRTQRCCHNRLDEGKLWENGRQQEGQFYFKDINHRTVHFIPNAWRIRRRLVTTQFGYNGETFRDRWRWRDLSALQRTNWIKSLRYDTLGVVYNNKAIVRVIRTRTISTIFNDGGRDAQNEKYYSLGREHWNVVFASCLLVGEKKTWICIQQRPLHSGIIRLWNNTSI